MTDYEMILQKLERKYPDRLLVGVKELAVIFDVSQKTVYNMTSRKSKRRFPVKSASGPGKKFKLTDIARALAEI